MACVTGNVLTVLVQVMIQQISAVVGCFGMTVLTGATSFRHRYGHTSTGDFMVSGAMALGTLEVIPAHMDIAIAIRMKQLPGKVGMFDGFSAAPVKMTDATAFSRGVAHVFSNLYQIHIRVGHPRPCRGFFIRPGGVVTHQAIDVAHIRKIKTVVFPAIACVTRCATSLVAYGANSEIVDGCCGFPVPNLLSVIHGIERWAAPEPMRCCQHIFPGFFVTAETFCGHFAGRWFTGQLDQLVMIRHIFLMASDAVHRALIHFLMAFHALQVISRL